MEVLERYELDISFHAPVIYGFVWFCGLFRVCIVADTSPSSRLEAVRLSDQETARYMVFRILTLPLLLLQ